MSKKLTILITMFLMVTCWLSFSLLAVGEPTIIEIPTLDAKRYEDLEIEATVTSDSTITEVKLYYRLGETLPYLSKTMTLKAGDLYAITIPGNEVWSTSFEYYVTAKNVDDLESSLGNSETPKEINIGDFIYDALDIPSILITEIYTAGANPGNIVEFFELYNNSGENINLFNYKISYVSRLYSGTLATPTFDLQYADRVINFGDLTEFILAPGQVIVIANGILESGTYESKSAIEYFNSFYGTALVLHEDIFFMTTTTAVPGNNAAGGMNSRGWAVRTLSDVVISQAFFHLKPDGSNFATNNTGNLPSSGLNSIQYGFKQMTILLDLAEPKREFMTMISADVYPANPGVIFTDQVPATPTAPEIEEIQTLDATRYLDLVVEATVTSESAITEVKLHYRLGETLPFLTKNMTLKAGDVYEVTIPGNEVWSLSFEYYITAKNTDDLESSLGNSESTKEISIDEFTYVAEDIPEILITEIYVAGANPGNQVEFFELYNNSGVDVNLFDYKMSYISKLYSGTLASHTFDLQYADKVINFGGLTEFILAPGQVVVIANGILENGTYETKSAVDYFNFHFGTSLVLHQDIFFMTTVTGAPGNNATGGMNSRGWAVKTPEGDIISQTFFHLKPDGSNFATNNTGNLPSSGLNSIQYGFKQMTILLDLNEPKREFMTMISADEYPANPGVVFTDQVPAMHLSPVIQTLQTSYDLSLVVNQTEIDLNAVLEDAYTITNRGMGYIASLFVTKNGDPVVVTNGKIAALEGVYKIKLVVTPSISEEFETIYSDEITLEVSNISVDPTVVILDSEVLHSTNTASTDLDLSTILASAFSVNNGSYTGSTVQTFIVTKNGEPVVVTENKIPFAEGEYSIVISIKPSTPDLFDDVISEVISLTIVIDSSTPVLTELIIDGSYKEDITINVNVNDEDSLNAVNPVKLYFRLDDKQIPISMTTAQYIEIIMTSVDNILFTATIDKAYTWSGAIEYYIEAKDNNGNIGRIGSSSLPEVISIDLPSYIITDQPKLLITEIYTSGGTNADPYEFFEVYNNYFEPVNLMLFSFEYVSKILTNYDTRNMSIEYAPKVVQWGAITEFFLNPGEVVVFANGNVSGIPTTAAQFNAFFPESAVVQGVNYFNILNEDNTTVNATGTNGAGGLNSRGWAIKSGDQLISQGFTHLALDGSNLPKNTSSLSGNGANKTSMLYSYEMISLMNTANTDPNNIWNKMVSVDQFIANPGWVFASQVPSKYTQLNPTIALNQSTISTSVTSELGENIDLLYLLEGIYTVDGKSFLENYNISFKVSKDGTVIQTTSQFFNATIGEYVVVIIVSPKTPNDFKTIESSNIQMVVNSNSLAPTITITVDEHNIDIESLTTGIDLAVALSEQFNIVLNDFELADVMISYIVTRDNEIITITNNILPLVAGTYEVKIRISPINEGAFVITTSDVITLKLYKEAPVLTPEGLIIYRTIAMEQTGINLSWLYTLDQGGYTENEYVISYSVTRESQQVHIIGSTIMPTPGTYRVTIMVDPVNYGAFEPISVTVTMIATKIAPTIAINDEYLFTIELMKNMTTISLQDMIFVHGGAFLSNEYTVSYSIKKGAENIPVTFMTIPAVLGDYNVTVTVYPNIPGGFPDVINDSIVLHLVPANPMITKVTTNTIIAAERDESLLLSSLYSLNTGYYDLTQINISYEVIKNGKVVNVVDGKIDAKNGEYTIKVIVEPKEDGLFTKAEETISITINNPAQTRANVILITSLSTLGIGTSIGTILFIRKRKSII